MTVNRNNKQHNQIPEDTYLNYLMLNIQQCYLIYLIKLEAVQTGKNYDYK